MRIVARKRKLQALHDLQDVLDEEMLWRRQEIHHLFTLVKQSKAPKQKSFIRASIPILYSHWEGFVKAAAEAYLNFVNNQELTYQELDTCFIIFGVKKRINELIEAKSPRVTIEALNFLLKEMESKAILQLGQAINTESNLTSKVLDKIALSIGLSVEKYEAKAQWIDNELVNTRNGIAHGENRRLDFETFKDFRDKVMELLEWFKTDIENAASTERYKAKELRDI